MINGTPPAPNGSRRLLAQVTCPHCWQRFAPEDVLWVASHGELNRDARLGEAPQRFLPSRFTPEGFAVDAKGMVCRGLACPHCHLDVLREMLETEPLFLSIAGDQASGKSYFLTAMIQQLREVLFHEFRVRFDDADPASNSVLTGYIESLFGRQDDDAPVPLGELIAKTQMAGDLYVPVTFGPQIVSYPRPFVFSLQPTAEHPGAKGRARLSRMLCLYDNAGEHFRPNANRVTNPCADHLALSRAVLFLFDPSQDRKFRAECRGETQSKAGGVPPSQQITILNEVAKRVRDYKGLPPDQACETPLVVVLTKFDAWSHLLSDDDGSDPWATPPRAGFALLDRDRIRARSGRLRELMMRYCRDVVAAAEGFAREVTYIAVSALADHYEPGRLHVDERSKLVSIRPRDVRPYWAAVPVLFALSRALPGLIPCARPKGPAGIGAGAEAGTNGAGGGATGRAGAMP
jgi:hypothetical protein